MARLGTEYWDSIPDVTLSHMKGFNAHTQLKEILYQTYPDLQAYEFGFFSRDAVPSRIALHWQHLTRDYFPDVDDFNGVVGLGMGLREDEAGHLMHGNNYVMIQGKKWRNEVFLPKQSAESERRFRAAANIGALDDGRATHGDVELTTQAIPKKKPGRPPKKG